ncbi:MAG TPA: hypothetical protein VLE95_03275 [Chlamydiales bacterium]|nr:hypothetical protein [Chlamydiales bacterium]
MSNTINCLKIQNLKSDIKNLKTDTKYISRRILTFDLQNHNNLNTIDKNIKEIRQLFENNETRLFAINDRLRSLSSTYSFQDVTALETSFRPDINAIYTIHKQNKEQLTSISDRILRDIMREVRREVMREARDKLNT